MIRVQSVAPDSLGAELGLTPGTELLAVNGRALEDFLDWEFLTAEDRFLLAARMTTGEEVEYDIERPEGLAMGVTLEPPRIRRCGNHCDFCFVDGNPQGLRSPLYIRDDDYRLSFRYGNFATLTNLKPWDAARIVEYRLSPLYVSVHATDLTVRRWLLRNPDAPDIIPQLRWFGERGIAFHAQVVLVPDVNDGPVLERTLGDLYGLGAAAGPAPSRVGQGNGRCGGAGVGPPHAAGARRCRDCRRGSLRPRRRRKHAVRSIGDDGGAVAGCRDRAGPRGAEGPGRRAAAGGGRGRGLGVRGRPRRRRPRGASARPGLPVVRLCGRPGGTRNAVRGTRNRLLRL